MATTLPPKNDKPFGISQIRAYIPIVLDMDKLNYDTWRELFETHCFTFGVSGHLDGSSPQPSTDPASWKEHDGLVKMWIYGTISESILDTVLKTKCTARDLWLSIENLFRDNKEARALQLDNELRNLSVGDLSIHEYCKKLKTLSDLLANVDSPVPERILVMHMLNGLNDKFDSIINVIKHKSPFPSFSTARSMLIMEEERLKKLIRPNPSNPHHQSASDVLYTASDSPQRYNSNSNNNNRGGRGRGRGGRFNNNNNRSRGGRYNNNGNNSWSTPPPLPSWPYSAPYPYPYGYPPHPSPQHNYYHGPSYASLPQHHQPQLHHSGSLLGPPPRQHGESHLTQSVSSTPPSDQIPTALSHAFNTMSLQDPFDPAWVMDTGATSHVTQQQGNLRSTFNLSPLPLIKVGNGALAPVTKMGLGSIPSSSRPLSLHNVLVCPSIIKNLISVRRFVTDNNCTVEFDPFGFSVKDLPTRLPLLRCNSSGPLYPVTQPAGHTMPLALTSGAIWHKRLGHLHDASLRRLASSSSFISSNKDSTLCHACQLGKHTRLPFVSSTSSVSSAFDLIHSDLWTSPVSKKVTCLADIYIFPHMSKPNFVAPSKLSNVTMVGSLPTGPCSISWRLKAP
ncbi:PREDICTED: uncharacterized protein LOC109132508 [Camelina sativa]|uniref:Uncharacterized protein LOC109132508 n=1 Tax=Camelina sativa TaxID=90675 RepID=A0ABM1RKZ8_CAMSA|nr:PREDICTED: uncharacterized protein LOC109132508 [Camelina sativa]